MNVLVIFHRLGPYHFARLEAASKYCKLSVIELSSIDKTYAWDKVVSKGNFRRRTLFNDKDVADQPFSLLKKRLFDSLKQSIPDVVAIHGRCASFNVWLQGSLPTHYSISRGQAIH